MCVYLGGGNTLMSQHKLNGSEIRPILQEMSSERVPKGMRANLLGKTNVSSGLSYNSKYHRSGELFATTV